MRRCVEIQPPVRVSRGSDQTFQRVLMRTIPLFSASSLGLRSPAFQTAFRLGRFRSGVPSLDSMRNLCNLTTLLYRRGKLVSTCKRGSRDVRQKLFQILCELVLIEDFLVAVVGFDEKTYLRLILFKKVGDLLVLGHRLQIPATNEHRAFSGIKAERLTRWIISRIPFAVFNTVAASPIAAVAVPNISAIVDEREKVVGRLRFAVVQEASEITRHKCCACAYSFQPPNGQPAGALLRKQR